MEEVKVKKVRKKKVELVMIDGVETAVVAPPKKKNYINNADLMKQIALSREAGKMSDELANMLFMLVTKYAKHSDYSAIYSYPEDMKAFALLTVVKVWKGFNPEKSNNPFAYFTQIIRHAFYQYLNHETKQRLIKDEVLVSLGEDPSFTYLEKYHEEADLEQMEADGESAVARYGFNATPAPVKEIDYSNGAISESTESNEETSEPDEV